MNLRIPKGYLYPTILLAIVGLLLAGVAWNVGAGSAPQLTPVTIAARNDLLPEERNTIDIFRKASPSVVHINTLSRRRSSFFSRGTRQTGSGSGFIWDARGHVVTNYHVIAAAERDAEIRVTLGDHTTYTAQVVGVTKSKDLAVLRIQADREKLHPLTIGSSSDLLVGQKVIAIGNPFGLD
ncbi:MAG: trypsin-like peptidase domain-containing protein, partial [Planctomycetota bacterium]